MKTHYTHTNTKYTDLQVRHQTALQNNKTLLDKLTQSTTILQSNTLKYNQAKLKSAKTISTLKKEITNLVSICDKSDEYIEELYEVITQQDNTLKRLTNELNNFKNGFDNITTSKLTQQAYDTLQSKYQSIEDTQYSIKCPITQEIIIEPVIAFDGQTYEKQAIQEWFKIATTLLMAPHYIPHYLSQTISLEYSSMRF